MCLQKVDSALRTMFAVLILVLVGVVGGQGNSTGSASGDALAGGRSRVAWLKTLFDHHEWIHFLNDTKLPSECETDLWRYVNALHDGQIWAAKMYDASGHYSSMTFFGNEYWLGSQSECSDLQLKKYYTHTPPFPTKFFVVKVNLTLDEQYTPQNRIILVGECLPASCGTESVADVVRWSERPANARAAHAGFQAAFHTLAAKHVSGSYELFADTKFHILGSAVIIVFVLMLGASLYEGYLERRYRMSKEQSDLELANDNNNAKPVDANVPGDKKPAEDEENKEGVLRRETCGVWSEVLLSFSVLSNGRTILSTQRPADGALTCLHGMRFLSVIWVIMVHTYLTVFYISENKVMRTVKERDFFYQPIGNASYCVDTFFFISGLLVTVLFLRSEDKKAAQIIKKKKQECNKQDINKNMNSCYTNPALSVSVISEQPSEGLANEPKSGNNSKREIVKIIKDFLLLFLYRVIRLSPAYAFVIGLNLVILKYINDRMLYEPVIFDDITCDLYWWRNLLYINNLYPMTEMCMVWSWYMANDTQFYVVGIILLLLSVKFPKVTLASVIAIMTSSWVITIYISVWHQYKARIQEPFEMFDALYDKPWSRIGPYLVGMAVGWYLHRSRCRARLPLWLVALGWACALAVFGAIIFGMVDGHLAVWPTAFYISIGHTAWGIALAWVTVCCCCGYGGLVNSALSYRGLLPLSRLTYCAYLVHPVIMVWTCFLLDGPFHLQNSMVLTAYAGYAVMAFLSSFVISIAFEAPAVRLMKIISGGCKKKTH